jgi:hypothetical protein
MKEVKRESREVKISETRKKNMTVGKPGEAGRDKK